MADQSQQQTVKRILTGPLAGNTGRYGGVMFVNGEAEIPAHDTGADDLLRRYWGVKAPDESDDEAQAKLGPTGEAARELDMETRNGISYRNKGFDAGAQHAHDAGTPQASGRAPKGDAVPGTIAANQAAIEAAKADKTAVAHPAARIDAVGTTETDAGTKLHDKAKKAVKAEEKAKKAQAEAADQGQADQQKAADQRADQAAAKDSGAP